MPLRVTVIVPTRNSERYLADCLRSVREQTYPHIDLIVVDNYSTDATVAIATNYDATILYGGPERSAQVNLGVQHALGDFVFRVDSDFVLDPRVVSACVDLARQGFDAVVVHNTSLITGWLSRIRKFEVDMYKYSLDHSAARFVRRTTFITVGGYPEAFTAGEDYDFQNRLLRHAVSVAYCEFEATHLDEPTHLWPVLVKYYRYGRDFAAYRRANPERRAVQLAFVRRDFLRHWRRMIRHPTLAMGLAIYHSAKYVAGGIGYVHNYVGRSLKCAEGPDR